MPDLVVTKDELGPMLASLRRRVGNMTPVMHILGNLIANQVKTGFRTGRDPYGKAWRPLRLRRGQPLRDTGRLMRSITYNVPSPTTVEIGTNVCYAVVHQTGAKVTAHGIAGKRSLCGYITTGAPMLAFKVGGRSFFAKSVTIPARKILPDGELPVAWRKSIVEAFNDYLGDAATGV